jgi:hypothetical protein
MYRTFIAAVLLTCTCLATADGSAVWRLYAFAKPTNQQAALFYLESEIVRTPGPGHVQVWIKALDVVKIEAAIGKKSAAIDKTADLIVAGYKPPLGTVSNLTSNQVLMIVAYEQVADQATVTPTVRILYEIDCAQKQIRILSLMADKPTAGENEPRSWPWQHVAPETTETLTKLVCRPS